MCLRSVVGGDESVTDRLLTQSYGEVHRGFDMAKRRIPWDASAFSWFPSWLQNTAERGVAGSLWVFRMSLHLRVGRKSCRNQLVAGHDVVVNCRCLVLLSFLLPDRPTIFFCEKQILRGVPLLLLPRAKQGICHKRHVPTSGAKFQVTPSTYLYVEPVFDENWSVDRSGTFELLARELAGRLLPSSFLLCFFAQLWCRTLPPQVTPYESSEMSEAFIEPDQPPSEKSPATSLIPPLEPMGSRPL